MYAHVKNMKTIHKILFQDARNLKEIASESVDLVVTSPPYPYDWHVG